LRYGKLQSALTESIGRPVTVEPCFVFQAKELLDSGWYAFAIITPTHYESLVGEEQTRILAIPTDAAGRVAREAVLVVAADSEIQSASELQGKVVAFGPTGDARTHHAALQRLAEAGVKRDDLKRELLPVPGALKHVADPRIRAQTVINGTAAAAFLDIAAWEALPAHSGEARKVGRDRLRIIDRTTALPSRLIIASPKLDHAVVKTLQEALLTIADAHPEALTSLNASGYCMPDEKTLSACRALVVKATDTAASQPESPEKDPDAPTDSSS
jgi:ABC-type phosphate/phosphonate transport system substrate-binding protein